MGLCRLRPRRAQPPARGLAARRPPAHRPAPGRPGDGRLAPPAARWRADPPQRRGLSARVQGVVATRPCWSNSSCSLRASAGVFQPSVLRGLAFSAPAMASISPRLHRERSLLLGRYWRSSPLDAPYLWWDPRSTRIWSGLLLLCCWLGRADRSRGSRWSARSSARTTDLDAGEGCRRIVERSGAKQQPASCRRHHRAGLGLLAGIRARASSLISVLGPTRVRRHDG